jgi:excinuclease UvrABC helicase subunit UvrB
MDNNLPNLQAHCQSLTIPNAVQSFAKELASQINKEMFKTFIPRLSIEFFN